MSLECGIVGLPNVGKSTLFNTLTSAQVAAENFPFCTVDPNKGVVSVPDPRLDRLKQMVKPQKVVPASMSFVDIAGLVKGAAQGEGLGNQFLSHIRSVDAIAHVVRCFENDQVTHVMGEVDPVRDVEIIDLELCLSDAERAERRIEKLSKIAKSGNAKEREELQLYQALRDKLSRGESLRRFRSEFEALDLSEFLTAKPILYIANLAEDSVSTPGERERHWLAELEKIAQRDGASLVSASIALEYQLAQIAEPADREEFFKEFGLEGSGLERLIREAYRLLGLITFFTAGEKEVRAWTIKKGDKAVDAAGTIHSDFARGFIRAEVIHYPDFVECGGEKQAREKGLQRAEGRDYEVVDGDVILFRFNV